MVWSSVWFAGIFFFLPPLLFACCSIISSTFKILEEICSHLFYFFIGIFQLLFFFHVCTVWICCFGLEAFIDLFLTSLCNHLCKSSSLLAEVLPLFHLCIYFHELVSFLGPPRPPPPALCGRLSTSGCCLSRRGGGANLEQRAMNEREGMFS